MKHLSFTSVRLQEHRFELWWKITFSYFPFFSLFLWNLRNLFIKMRCISFTYKVFFGCFSNWNTMLKLSGKFWSEVFREVTNFIFHYEMLKRKKKVIYMPVLNYYYFFIYFIKKKRSKFNIAKLGGSFFV